MTKRNDAKQQQRPPETMIARLTRLLNAEESRMTVEKNAAKRQTAARTVVMLCAELRKAEAAMQKNSDELTKAEVVEWFRALTDTEQERLLRELPNLRRKGSGLA